MCEESPKFKFTALMPLNNKEDLKTEFNRALKLPGMVEVGINTGTLTDHLMISFIWHFMNWLQLTKFLYGFTLIVQQFILIIAVIALLIAISTITRGALSIF